MRQVLLIAFVLTTTGLCQAQDSDIKVATAAPDMTHVGIEKAPADRPQVNGFDQYRRSPDPGLPVSPGYGYKHFAGPQRNYTNWYRPRAATRSHCVRCEPAPWRPRGFGNLFNRPCDNYRMEYTPYVINGHYSVYGPSYLRRAPDPRCADCDK